MGVVSGRLARGTVLVALALARRLDTPRGTLRENGEGVAYGLDLSAYVGAVGYPTAVAAIPGLVRGELLKDDRVSDVAVTAVIETSDAGLISITLTVDAVLSESGEAFALTLSVSDTSLTVLGIAA